MKELRKAGEKEASEVPLSFVTGYGRSVGLADMAVAPRSGRVHRASGEQAFCVLDLMQGFLDSSSSGKSVAPLTKYQFGRRRCGRICRLGSWMSDGGFYAMGRWVRIGVFVGCDEPADESADGGEGDAGGRGGAIYLRRRVREWNKTVGAGGDAVTFTNGAKDGAIQIVMLPTNANVDPPVADQVAVAILKQLRCAADGVGGCGRDAGED